MTQLIGLPMVYPMIHAIERAILLDVSCEVYVTSREMSYAVLGRTSCVVGHSV